MHASGIVKLAHGSGMACIVWAVTKIYHCVSGKLPVFTDSQEQISFLCRQSISSLQPMSRTELSIKELTWFCLIFLLHFFFFHHTFSPFPIFSVPFQTRHFLEFCWCPSFISAHLGSSSGHRLLDIFYRVTFLPIHGLIYAQFLVSQLSLFWCTRLCII